MFSLRDLSFIFLTVSIWGTNFVAVRWGLDELPPLYLTGLRFLLVAFPAVFFIPKPDTELWKVFLLGLFVCLGQFSLLFIAIELGLKPGLASLIMQSQVIFTIILSFAIFDERLSLVQFVGIVISFLGFSFFLKGSEEGQTQFLPVLIALSAAFSWACGNQVYKVVGNVNRVHLTIWSSLVPILPMFLMSLLIEGQGVVAPLFGVSVKGWGSILFSAYLSTIVAYSLWGDLLGRFPSAMIVPFALTIPIFGFLSAWILLDERLARIEVLASVIIAIGLAICVFSQKLNRFFRSQLESL